MAELNDQQKYFLSLDKRAQKPRAEIAIEQRLMREHMARWAPKDNVIAFQSQCKSTEIVADGNNQKE